MMDEYTKRADAMEAIRKRCNCCTEPCPMADMAHEAAKGRMYATNEFILLQKKVESGQLVEVVRCRDCKYFQHYGRTSLFIDGKHVKAGWCTRRILYDEEYRMLPDGFCSSGERKGGGSDES